MATHGRVTPSPQSRAILRQVKIAQQAAGHLMAPLGDSGRRALLDTVTVALKALQKVSFGRLGNSIPFGPPVIWITTRGRKSGLWRQNPLVAVREHDEPGSPWVVTGTNAGQAKTPAWVFNARATPEGFATDRGRHWQVRFEEAEGADAERLFAHLESSLSWFTSYRERLEREVPVFRVIPVTRIDESDLPDVGQPAAAAAG